MQRRLHTWSLCLPVCLSVYVSPWDLVLQASQCIYICLIAPSLCTCCQVFAYNSAKCFVLDVKSGVHNLHLSCSFSTYLLSNHRMKKRSKDKRLFLSLTMRMIGPLSLRSGDSLERNKTRRMLKVCSVISKNV